MEVFNSNSVEETRNFGKKFAKNIKKGQIFALVGAVGCGKTEFVRGILEELSPNQTVSSPTFSVVNKYEASDFDIFHFDFYRIKSANELFEIGFDEYIRDDSVVFVEWANMYPEVLGKNAQTLKFEAVEENQRKITILSM